MVTTGFTCWPPSSGLVTGLLAPEEGAQVKPVVNFPDDQRSRPAGLACSGWASGKDVRLAPGLLGEEEYSALARPAPVLRVPWLSWPVSEPAIIDSSDNVDLPNFGN